MIAKVAFIELVPSKGMWLTQKELKDDEQRIFSDKAFTPNGQEDAWIEWTDAQKVEYEEALERQYSEQAVDITT